MRTRPRSVAVAESGAPAAEVATGIVQIAVSPWGEVEVDGRPAGTTPPLSRLTLPEGTHTITLRNADFPPLTTTVHVQADKPAVVRHRFGS
jgi:eukaryotic-like serine/threonine-protein kinase